MAQILRTKQTEALLDMVRQGRPMGMRQQIVLTLLLSVPAMLAQLSNIVMEYIDASMVGSLGAEASASIGLVATSTWLIWGICGSAAAGFTVQVAHRIGARDDKGARQVYRQGLTATMLLSVSVGLVAACLSGSLPHWLGGTDEICGDASRYFCIVALTLPFCQLTMLSGGVLRSSGNVVLPSMLNMLMCCMDVIFNFLLIFPTRQVDLLGVLTLTVPGAGMGVTGAATGTLCAEAVTALLMTWYASCRQPSLRLKQDNGVDASFAPRADVMRKAYKIAMPMGIQHLAMTSAQVVGTTIVAPLGKMSIAANSFGITAEGICYMPGYGIAEAAQTLVGQSTGANRPDLTRTFAKVTVGLGMMVMTVMGIVMYAAAPLMMAWLTPVEEIRQLGIEALRIEAFAEPMFAAAIVCYGIFVGAGDTLKPCIMNLLSMWGVRLTLAAWLAPTLGLWGVWLAMCIELCVRGAIFLLRLKIGHWQKPALVDSNRGNKNDHTDIQDQPS